MIKTVIFLIFLGASDGKNVQKLIFIFDKVHLLIADQWSPGIFTNGKPAVILGPAYNDIQVARLL